MWASQVKSPTLGGALSQFPSAEVLQPTDARRVHYVDGQIEDWWVWSTDLYEVMTVLRLRLPNNQVMLIEKCAVDQQLTTYVYGRLRGRFAFVPTGSVVALVGLHYEYRAFNVNLADEIKRIHKSLFSIGLKWPSGKEVDEKLRAYDASIWSKQ